MEQLTSMCEMFCQFIQKKQKEKRIEGEQTAKVQNSKIPVCYDDNDDYNSAITPNEPVDSLSMGDEHLNTISATESDEFIKSCVENLVPNPSESEGENGCDVLAFFTTFSNILFDAEYEFDSVDDQSLSDKDFPEEIFSNPLFKEEIIPMKIDQHHFNVESDLIESMLNHDSSIIPSSSKIDSLLDEFAGELTILKSIPPGIDETDCHPDNEIRVTKRLLYDNSSPRLPEEFVSENSSTEIKSFSSSPILVEDSDSRMEEIDLSFNPDDLMPPRIEDDDDDSERDILILEELPSNYSISLPENESFRFDIPSFSRPPAKPPDGNIGILNIKMMGDNSKQKLSAKRPMMIHGKNIPILDVPLFYFYPLDQFNYGRNWVKLSDIKQALRERHPMPIIVQYSWKLEDSCQRILSSKSSFPQLQLGIILLHLACSQPMLKSSYKAEDGVIISILPLVGDVDDVVVEIKTPKQEEKRIEGEQTTKVQNSKIPVCYDDNDDYNYAIIPNEPVDSLSMGDEHLNTISATELDEFIKSCVENLVPNPSESEGENGCDVLACFTTFSNILFDAEYEFDSVDDQSLSDKDFPEEIFSNPLFEEEIIPMKIDQHHFNAESDLIESMLNHDSSIIPSFSKIDSLLDEFAGELTLLKSIPPGIDETDCHPENEIRLTKRLLYDNSSSRPPEEFVSENSNTEIESFSPSPIPVEDSDSRMEEIDLSFNPDDLMPSSIEDDDDDSERDILILEELPSNYSISLPENESFRFDIPSFSRPPAKPPDGNTEILNIKMMGDNSKQKLSAKRPMMIHGKNIPILDVPLFYFYPLDQFNYGRNWVKLSDLKQALRGRHPMLISSIVFLFSSQCFCLLCAIILWKPVFLVLL
nr:hypothetical protein [Tanacetum cinerariifolium]